MSNASFPEENTLLFIDISNTHLSPFEKGGLKSSALFVRGKSSASFVRGRGIC